MRVGVLGGTFDPPHLGHLILASEAQTQLGLEVVLWVVTGRSPFKVGRAITDAVHRVDMVRAAIVDNPAFELSRIDVDRAGPHFTADTVALIAQRRPDDELFFLMGADSLADFPRWQRPDAILRCCRLAVLRRPGAEVDLDPLSAVVPGLAEKVQWVNAPQVEISASDLRSRVRAGRSIRYFVPEAVREIVLRRRLYAPAAGV